MDNKSFGKSYSKFFLNTLISSALLLCLIGFSAVQINAETPTPVVRSDNPSCADLGYSNGYKVDAPAKGTNTYTLPNGGTIIVNIDEEGKVLDFYASEQFIAAVIVKGAEDANVYYYTPSVREGGPLTSPMKNGRIPEISHFSFCYDNVAAVGIAPTATTAMIAGRVTVDTGFVRGNGSFAVMILNTRTSETQVAFTNRLGYYEFNDLQVGDTYVVTVRGKGYSFTPQTFTLVEDSSLDMLGMPVGRSGSKRSRIQ